MNNILERIKLWWKFSNFKKDVVKAPPTYVTRVDFRYRKPLDTIPWRYTKMFDGQLSIDEIKGQLAKAFGRGAFSDLKIDYYLLQNKAV